MKDEQRLIEIMAELLAEVHDLKNQLGNSLDTANGHLKSLDNRMDGLEKQQAKTNLSLGELRLSILKLAERDNVIDDHEQRLKFLENKISKAS